jgi:hypothetical protein
MGAAAYPEIMAGKSKVLIRRRKGRMCADETNNK